MTHARIEIRAKPRSRESRVAGVADGVVLVCLKATPIDGAANAELVTTLARALGLTKSHVVILRGHTGRTKLVEVEGLSTVDVYARLARIIHERRGS